MENKAIKKSFLKFKKDSKGFIGFVHESDNGALIGVREDDIAKKKTCIISKSINQSDIKENVLYAVELMPTKGRKMYIVTALSEALHKARVKLYINNMSCQAVLIYGNHRIYYNPLNGKSEFSTTAKKVEELIQEAEISNKKEALEAMRRAMAKVDKHIKNLPRGRVETMITAKCYYQSIIKFGPYKVVYNPFDGSENERSFKRILSLIDNKLGISNKEEVKEAFLKSASVIHRYMEADGFFVKNDAV